MTKMIKFIDENFRFIDGSFYWKLRPAKRVKVGDRAGWLEKRSGYRKISINGEFYKEHRIVWMYCKGYFPNGMIDHINGDRQDNRIENLRDVNNRENTLNTYKHRSGKLSGASFNKQYGKWESFITVQKKITIGYFNDEISAHKATIEYKKMAK